MAYHARPPYDEIKQLKLDVTELSNLFNVLETTIKQINGLLDPIFHTCTAGALRYLDPNGVAVDVEDKFTELEGATDQAVQQCQTSADNAKTSETKAKTSETNAKTS